jgi:proton glutamate symport protein
MSESSSRGFRLTLSRQILLGVGIGVLAGALVGRWSPEHAELFRPFSQLFLRLIKMVIGPLIFASLVGGIAGAGHVRTVGRMGIRALVYFEVLTTIALGIGLAAVNLTRPGAGVDLNTQTGSPAALAPPQTWDQLIVHAVPTSIVQALAENDVLQVVVFSIFFAIALGMIGERGRPVVALCQSITEVMFRVTDLIMRFAPIGVGCAMAYTVAHGGLQILWHLGGLVGTLYLALAVFFAGVLLPVALLFRIPLRPFIAAVREPALIAFSTTSSEAALPRAMESLEALGIPRRIVAFVMPVGYSFNLDGTALYLSLATIFVAQAANVPIGWGRQVAILLTLMLTSKGVAGVPRAALVVLAGTLTSFQLPVEGIALLLGVDALMDMGRTMTNVVGNCLATAVIARWEGAFPSAVLEPGAGVEQGDGPGGR